MVLLSDRFRNFSINECRGSSELYEYLAIKIAEDHDMLELSSHCKEGQPAPNLFLGAVHYLLLKGINHPLKEFYPSITKHPKEISNSFASFKDFCRIYRKEIISVLQTKLVQTNEVRRCAYLYPTFCYIYEKVKKPLALIEIGTSAGLQLLWDKYCYTYGTEETFGDKNAKVKISSEVKDTNQPFLLFNSPPVINRIGLDLHVNDLLNEEDYLWLKSLIWPNHTERRELFDQAADCVKENSQLLHFVEGDGIAFLYDIAETIPKEAVICVFHTHVANQFSKESKQSLLDVIKRIGGERDIFHLYNNMKDRDLHLDYILSGHEYMETVGKTDGHGRWFTWGLKPLS